MSFALISINFQFQGLHRLYQLQCRHLLNHAQIELAQVAISPTPHRCTHHHWRQLLDRHAKDTEQRIAHARTLLTTLTSSPLYGPLISSNSAMALLCAKTTQIQDNGNDAAHPDISRNIPHLVNFQKEVDEKLGNNSDGEGMGAILAFLIEKALLPST